MALSLLGPKIVFFGCPFGQRHTPKKGRSIYSLPIQWPKLLCHWFNTKNEKTKTTPKRNPGSRAQRTWTEKLFGNLGEWTKSRKPRGHFRDPYMKHTLNIATCTWRFPTLFWWKSHVSIGQHVSFKEPRHFRSTRFEQEVSLGFLLVKSLGKNIKHPVEKTNQTNP